MRERVRGLRLGARADRVGLRAALDYVRDGDVLIVWKLDRLGRAGIVRDLATVRAAPRGP